VSGAGAPKLHVEGAADLRIAIVSTHWNAEIMAGLLDGAQRAVGEAGVLATPEVIVVPGAFELPVAAAVLARSGRFDAIVCLGLVIRGGTPHFDYVCQGATIGITEVATSTGIPIGFGVLTCDNEQQAFDRSGLPGASEDKGHEAAMAAIATAVLLRAYR
jgi:6,7-dimethyl-8-ribityllumazine synthase